MIKQFLRHWVLLDYVVFRRWLTDARIDHARLIDNQDGTYGRAFDLRNVDPDAIIAASDTMQTALEAGTDAIEPLPTGPPRVLRPSPNLQDLVARFGRYDLITPEAWARFDAEKRRWLEDVRHGRAEIISTKANEHDAA
jgi:hypothetical protein